MQRVQQANHSTLFGRSSGNKWKPRSQLPSSPLPVSGRYLQGAGQGVKRGSTYTGTVGAANSEVQGKVDPATVIQLTVHLHFLSLPYGGCSSPIEPMSAHQAWALHLMKSYGWGCPRKDGLKHDILRTPLMSRLRRTTSETYETRSILIDPYPHYPGTHCRRPTSYDVETT